MITESALPGLAPALPGAPAPAPGPAAPAAPFMDPMAMLGMNQDQLAQMPVIKEEIDWGDLNVDLRLRLEGQLEEQLVSDVLSQIQTAEDSRTERIDTVKKVRNRYYLEKPDRTPFFEQGANFHVPYMRWTMDALAARILGAAFQKPIVSAKGVRGQQDAERAARMEPFLEWANREQLKLPMTYDEVVERVMTDGVLFIKVPWRRYVHNVRRRRLMEERMVMTDEETGLPLLDESGRPQIKLIHRYGVEEELEETFHGPTAEITTIEHFIMPDPNEAALEKQPWLAQEFFLTRKELWDNRRRTVELNDQQQEVGAYDHVAEILKSSPFTRREDTARHGAEAEFNAKEGVDTQLAGTALVGVERCYEVLWPYRTWRMVLDPETPNPDALPSRVLLTITAESRKLIEAKQYPFWDPEPECMWVKVFLIQKQGRAHNPSVGELLMTVQDEIDTIHWQRADATTVLILSFLTFLAEEGSADDLEKIILGAKNVVQNIQGIKLLADVIRTGLQAPGLDQETLVLKFGELLMGIAHPQLGVESSGSATATEIGTLVREGALKFGTMVSRLGESIIAVSRRAIRRYAQFYPLVEDMLERVRGAEPSVMKELALEDLQIHLDLELRGTSIAVNKELEAAKAFRLLELSESSRWVRALLMANPAGVYELVSTVLQTLDWPGGPEVLIGERKKAMAVLEQVLGLMTMTEMAPIIAQMAAMMGAGAGEAAPGGNGGAVPTPKGPNTATLRAPMADMLNKSGLSPHIAAMLAQPGATK